MKTNSPTADEKRLTYEDPVDIIHEKLPLAICKEALKHHLTNSKIQPSSDIFPKADILSGNIPSIDQINKIREQEQEVSAVLQKEHLNRSKEDIAALMKFFEPSVAIVLLKKEYGSKVAERILRQATYYSYKDDEPIIKLGIISFLINPPIEQTCPSYFLIVSGTVKIMQPVARIKAFATIDDYKDYRKENLATILSEKKPTDEAIEAVRFINRNN